MTRDYLVRIKSYGAVISDDKFESLWDACIEISKKLKNMNILEIFSMGTFDETEMNNEKYYKKYVITYPELSLEITLKKLSTGNINQELVREYIKEIKILYERIDNRPR